MTKRFSKVIAQAKQFVLARAEEQDLNIKVVDSYSELNSFTDTTIEAVSKITADPLFNSFLWINTWVDTFKISNYRPFVIFIYKNNQLKGVMETQVGEINVLGKLLLKPLGQGEPEDEEVLSEYQDICCSDDVKEAFLALINEFINTFCYRVIWRNTDTNANIVNCLKLTITSSKYSRFLYEKKLGETPQALTKNTLKKYKRLNNKLARLPHKFYWVKKEDKGFIFEVLAQLHSKRWSSKGDVGAMSRPRFRAFHQKLLAEHSITRLSALEINDEIVAVHYYLSSSNTLYFYQSGWDIEKYPELSLGFMLHIWSMNNNCESRYDFMIAKKGTRIKQQLSNITQDTVSIDHYINPIYCKCAIFLGRALQKIRSVFKL